MKNRNEEIGQLKQKNVNLTEEIQALKSSKKQLEINILQPQPP